MKKVTKRLWEKKNSKKGFTLVELIVVLVILAILAAIMVPALLGWIDKAKEKQVMLEARSVYLAAQTVASEEYAKPVPNAANVTGDLTSAGPIQKLSGTNGTLTVTLTGFTVTGMEYTMVDGSYKAVLNAGTWTYTKLN